MRKKNYKFSYIADKTMFKAVMFANKMIRDTHCFNVSVAKSAAYYAVDEEELAQKVKQWANEGKAYRARKRRESK